MRLGIGLVLGSLVLGWLGGCGKVSPGDQVGGETHWLKQCAASSECGSSLECLCGVCTRGCDDDAACTELGAARCSPRSETAYASACIAAEPERLCVRAAAAEPDPPIVTPLQGRRYDASADCLGPSEVAGSIRSTAPITCDDLITYGTDGESCWQFPSSCLPEGFNRLTIEVIDSLCFTARPCPGTLTCPEGQVSTIDGCLVCDEAEARLSRSVADFVQGAGFDTCSTDLDCVLQDWQTACRYACPDAVAAANAPNLEAVLSDVTGQYCSDPAEWIAVCGPPPELECVPSSPFCRGGRCILGEGPPCVERPLDGCDYDGVCALARAFPFDAEQQCFAETTIAVGCVNPELTCPPVTTPGLDGDGNCFMFGNCLPPGFERAPEDHACWQALGSTCGS